MGAGGLEIQFGESNFNYDASLVGLLFLSFLAWAVAVAKASG